jgi:hypothetical protein
MKQLTTEQILAIYDLFVSAGIDKRSCLYKSAQASHCDIQTVAIALYFREC